MKWPFLCLNSWNPDWECCFSEWNHSFSSWFCCFGFFCCFHFLQSYSGFSQKWIIILQEFNVLDMKQTLKVMTIKTSGWPKEHFRYHYLDEQKNWTREFDQFRACCDDGAVPPPPTWKRSYIFLFHITDVKLCVHVFCHLWPCQQAKADVRTRRKLSRLLIYHHSGQSIPQPVYEEGIQGFILLLFFIIVDGV